MTVLLDGQGADEIFGGYHGRTGGRCAPLGRSRSLRGLAADRSRARGDVVAIARLGPARRASPRAPPAPRRRRTRRRTWSDAAARVIPPAAHGRWTAGRWRASCCAELFTRACRNSSATRTATRWRTAARCACRSSTAGVAELALSLPAGFVYRDGVTKAVLRDAVRGLVPAAGARAPGQGRLRDAAGALALRARRVAADRRGAARPRRAGARPLRRRARSRPTLRRRALARPARDLARPECRAVAAPARRLEGRGAGRYRPEALGGSPG